MTTPREAELERRLEASETVIAAFRLDRPYIKDGDEELLRRLAELYRALYLAGDPMAAQGELGGSRGRAAEPAYPGAATAYARRIKGRLNRAVSRAVADAHTQLDGDWEAPPRCPSCHRSCRFTDRWCGRCGTRLGTKPETETAQSDASNTSRARLSSRSSVGE